MAGGAGMQADVTRAQLVTVTLFTVVMLVAGMTLPAAFVNLRLSAHDVRGAIMPPGMIMTRETLALGEEGIEVASCCLRSARMAPTRSDTVEPL